MNSVFVNSSDYPIPLGALPFLCDASVWREYVEARNKWMVVAKDINGLTRACTFKAQNASEYFVSRESVVTKRDLSFRQAGLEDIFLKPDQARAFDEFDGIRFGGFISGINASVISRIQSGKLKVIARKDAISPWSIIDGDAFKNRQFCFSMDEQIDRRWRSSKGSWRINGSWKTFGPVCLRDDHGISFHQALYAYGEVEKVIEFETLEAYGAPNYLNQPLVIYRGVTIGSAAIRWRELCKSLLQDLLKKLKASDLVLVGHEKYGKTEVIISRLENTPIDEWPNEVLVKSASGLRETVITSRPAVRETIRACGPGDVSSSPVILRGPGRPPVAESIRLQFYNEYLGEDGTLKLSKTEIAKALVKWVKKNRPNEDCPAIDTIAFKKINEWLGEWPSWLQKSTSCVGADYSDA